jgi:hypothetical protein
MRTKKERREEMKKMRRIKNWEGRLGWEGDKLGREEENRRGVGDIDGTNAFTMFGFC